MIFCVAIKGWDALRGCHVCSTCGWREAALFAPRHHGASWPWHRQLVLSSFASVHSGLPRLFTHQADLVPLNSFCCLESGDLFDNVHQVKKKKFSQTSLHKEGRFVWLVYFCYLFVSFPHFVPSPFLCSTVAKFCQEVSDLNVHRPATEAGKALAYCG